MTIAGVTTGRVLLERTAPRRAVYRVRKGRGICTSCPRLLLTARERSTGRCTGCIERQRDSYQRRSPTAAENRKARDRRRRLELKKTAEGRAHLAKLDRASRARRKLSDRCLECGRPAAPDRERCRRHLRKAAAAARRRRRRAARARAGAR